MTLLHAPDHDPRGRRSMRALALVSSLAFVGIMITVAATVCWLIWRAL